MLPTKAHHNLFLKNMSNPLCVLVSHASTFLFFDFRSKHCTKKDIKKNQGLLPSTPLLAHFSSRTKSCLKLT